MFQSLAIDELENETESERVDVEKLYAEAEEKALFCHVLASLLKKLIREVPGGFIPSDCMQQLSDVNLPRNLVRPERKHQHNATNTDDDDNNSKEDNDGESVNSKVDLRKDTVP